MDPRQSELQALYRRLCQLEEGANAAPRMRWALPDKEQSLERLCRHLMPTPKPGRLAALRLKAAQWWARLRTPTPQAGPTYARSIRVRWLEEPPPYFEIDLDQLNGEASYRLLLVGAPESLIQPLEEPSQALAPGRGAMRTLRPEVLQTIRMGGRVLVFEPSGRTPCSGS